MYFDTHAHYDSEAFDEDRDLLLKSLPERGVDLVVNPGSDAKSSAHSIELAERYSHIYAAVGWHPHEADSFGENSIEQLRTWLQHGKVVAIGEIGLDYHYDFSPREQQRTVFRAQMQLAEELNVPVIVHDRDAHADSMEIVRAFPQVLGVFHCYSGSAEMAKELLNLGWYLSFTGAITFKNARKALETIECAPMDRIMIETDSPYLTPVPNRGKRNDSTQLPYIAQVIADIKGISLEEAAKVTMENGRRFFGIQD